jgi:hypothetical protein
MGTGSFPGVKRPGRDVDHPPSSSTEVKERVQLYLYSPPGPSWPVLGLLLLLFYCNWVDTRWQQYSTHLHTNSTQITEDGTHITVTRERITITMKKLGSKLGRDWHLLGKCCLSFHLLLQTKGYSSLSPLITAKLQLFSPVCVSSAGRRTATTRAHSVQITLTVLLQTASRPASNVAPVPVSRQRRVKTFCTSCYNSLTGPSAGSAELNYRQQC